MTLTQIINRVQSYTRDFNGSIFRVQDITDFANEGIDRLRSIPELTDMPAIVMNTDAILYLPTQYHVLIAMYSASRCFFLDGQSYNAGTMMNEFETKMDELKGKIANGDITILDADGLVVIPTYATSAVVDVYFSATSDDTDNLEDYIKFFE